jgi:hypothetical protein
MIKLRVFDNRIQHGVFYTDEPARFEFIVTRGRLVIDAYMGTGELGVEEEPIGCYDGNIDSGNWEKG